MSRALLLVFAAAGTWGLAQHCYIRLGLQQRLGFRCLGFQDHRVWVHSLAFLCVFAVFFFLWLCRLSGITCWLYCSFSLYQRFLGEELSHELSFGILPLMVAPLDVWLRNVIDSEVGAELFLACRRREYAQMVATCPSVTSRFPLNPKPSKCCCLSNLQTRVRPFLGPQNKNTARLQKGPEKRP